MMTALRKTIGIYLIKNEKALTSVILAFLCVVVLSRIIMAYSPDNCVDTHYFVETARLILKGISPYHPETNPTPYKYPVQSPSMSLLTMPLCFFPEAVQYLCFFICGVVTFVGLTLWVFYCYGFHVRDYILPCWKNVPIWIVLALVFISSPFLMMLRHGQNSTLAAICLFLVLLNPKRDNGLNMILLGLAAAVKYSLLTMQAPVLIVQKRIRLCFFSFLLFLSLVLVVGLWLDGIIPAFKEYIDLLARDMSRGANSYANANSFSFIHVGFFKYDYLNVLLKISLVVLYLLSLLRIYIRQKNETVSASCVQGQALSAVEWGAFTSMTLVITYHRAYDGVLFLPFAGLVFVELLSKLRNQLKLRVFDYFCMLSLAGILLFWAMPQSFVFAFEAWFGKLFPFGRALFLYSSYPVKRYTTMFPFSKLTMLFTTYLLFAMGMFPQKDRKG